MGSRSSVLFHALLDDLSSVVPGEVLSAFREGRWGHPWVYTSPHAFATQSLCRSLLKKYIENTSNEAEARAFRKFSAVNDRCKTYEVRPETLLDEELLAGFKRTLHAFLDSYVLPKWSFQDAFWNGYCGPGASLGASGDDSYSKLFSSKLTTTSDDLGLLYKRSTNCDPRRQRAELLRSTLYGDFTVVQGNHMSFVPKTTEIHRTICTEPSLNMFYQLGFKSILEAALLKGFGIDLEEQQFRNRRLAQLGSLERDPRQDHFGFSTIDLASASDSVSLALCKWAFPSWFLGPLMMTRSRVSRYKGRDIELHMLSTMGNGYTFPLQTAIFASAVIAVYELKGKRCFKPFGSLRSDKSVLLGNTWIPGSPWSVRRGNSFVGNWGVYGDDIICHNDCYGMVTRLLGLLGFEVNGDKSFNQGLFRESCGGDFFKGHDVRGVYIESLHSQQDRCSAINRLNRWSARWGIPLPLLVGSILAGTRRLWVPRWEAVECGLHVPMSVAAPRVKWSASFQSLLYKKWSARVPCLRVDANLQYVYEPKSKGRFKHKSRIFNPEGLGLALLGGSLRADKISIRRIEDATSFVLKHGVAPHWDATQIGTALELEPSAWRWWDTIVLQNLGLDVPS